MQGVAECHFGGHYKKSPLTWPPTLPSPPRPTPPLPVRPPEPGSCSTLMGGGGGGEN